MIYNLYRGPWVPKEKGCDLVLVSFHRRIKKPAGFVKRGPLGPQSTRLDRRWLVGKYIQIFTMLDRRWLVGKYIQIFTTKIARYYVHLYINKTAQVNMYNLYIITKQTGMGRVLPHFICGEATICTFFTG